MPRKKNLLPKLKQQLTDPASGSESTTTVTTGPSLQVQDIPSQNTLHQSCSTLTLDRFINIMISGSLQFLVITGSPTDDELHKAWEKITTEYSGMVKTADSIDIFECYKKLWHTMWMIGFTDTLVNELKREFNEENAEELMLLGFSQVVRLEDREEYLKQLYRVETEAKYLVVLLNQYSNEYKMLRKDDEQTDIHRTVLDYESEIAILSKYQHYRIRKEHTTVTEYCAIINNYIAEHDRMRRHQQYDE